MKPAIAALLVLAASSGLAAGQQQTAPPSASSVAAEQQQQTSKVPPMSEDRRVKVEAIDSEMARAGLVLLDVREPKEIEELGGYEGAINIPITQLEKRLGELPKDKTYLTA